MSNIEWYNLKMTSNTAPAPFVASASGSYDNNISLYGAYKAFDGKNNDSISSSTDYQAWASITSINNWIKIDFGEKKEIDIVKLSARGSAGLAQTPTSFKVEGSVDDATWNDIGTFTKIWSANEESLFTLKKGNYRYLKITDLATSSKISAWSEITFGLINPKKLILKNPTTNKHYSLEEKTLIHLPSSSNKNMILHGIEAGKEIKLDEAFDKVFYILENNHSNVTDLSLLNKSNYTTITNIGKIKKLLIKKKE